VVGFGTGFSTNSVTPCGNSYARHVADNTCKRGTTSDRPHPTQKENDKANEAVLIDLLTEWVRNEVTRQRILVENPASLYGFSK